MESEHSPRCAVQYVGTAHTSAFSSPNAPAPCQRTYRPSDNMPTAGWPRRNNSVAHILQTRLNSALSLLAALRGPHPTASLLQARRQLDTLKPEKCSQLLLKTGRVDAFPRIPATPSPSSSGNTP